MATWISNFLAKLHLHPSTEPFILNVLYDEALSEDEKSVSIFDFFEINVKVPNINLQDAVSELFAQYQRHGLHMMVAPEYYPRVQNPTQRPSTTLRPPAKEFVPKSALAAGSGHQQDVSEDEAEIHGVDPTKAKTLSKSDTAWARIDDDDDKVEDGKGQGHDNDDDVFRVPNSQIYDDEQGDGIEEGYEDQDYYDEGDAEVYAGYGDPWQQHQQQHYEEQAWGDDPYEHDEFDPFAPPNMADMQVLQSVQGYSTYAGYSPSVQQQQQMPYSSDAYQGYYNPYDPTVALDPYGQQQQQQRQETTTHDMSPLEMLQQILSDMKPEQIEQAFEENGHDMDAALSAIITKRQKSSQLSVNDPLQQFIPKGDPRASQTCRFFLQGKCFRKDCWYSHDLGSVVCRFWLKGECFKGNTCEFSHGLDAGKLTEVVEVEPPKPQALPSMDEWDFPSLSSIAKPGSSKKGDSKSNGSKSSKTSSTTAADATVDALAEDLGSKARVSDGAKVATTTTTTTGSKPPGLSYSATAAKAASKPLTRLRPSSPSSNSRDEASLSQGGAQLKFNLSMAPSWIPWLETGSTLNQQYLKARAQAAEYAAARNRCFEMAKQAYLRNDSASAGRYSAEGRQYNERMMATHREASQQIFATRNAHRKTTTGAGSGSRHGGSNSGERNETWIDLHGLHVEEALVFLDQFMEKLENEVYTGVVYVVTGTGHHSTLGLAKVRQAVLEWLVDWGYLHREISVDGVHGGIVAVQVVKGRPQ